MVVIIIYCFKNKTVGFAHVVNLYVGIVACRPVAK
jgi:hypothetical protein